MKFTVGFTLGSRIFLLRDFRGLTGIILTRTPEDRDNVIWESSPEGARKWIDDFVKIGGPAFLKKTGAKILDENQVNALFVT